MADAFRPELPSAALRTALHQKSPVTKPLPKWSTEPFVVHDWRGKPSWQVGHRVSSEPRIRLLTGETSGAPITMEILLCAACDVEVPRTCRVASTISSKPWM